MLRKRLRLRQLGKTGRKFVARLSAEMFEF